MTTEKTSLLIGITGASGSGKTHLSKRVYSRLHEEFADVNLLCEDKYYRDQSKLTFEQRTSVNYDHPDALEHSLLIEQVSELARGATVNTPVYDYSRHTRFAEPASCEPSKILIVEGILILHPVQLRDLFDLRIFVDTSLELCLERRIKRDSLERARSRDSVVQQFETSVRPMFHQFVEPTRKYADIVVEGSGEMESDVESIVTKVVELAG